eukprot:GHVT01005335.1.p1 GENE.GHVT01005335.1~~GHVT01005335.1.p1  ORF type:complete len:256 (+),score=20.36 GHVT01005335.1:411-1178(+)
MKCVLIRFLILEDLFPLPMENEVFFLRRTGISFQAKTPTITFKGSGDFYLTSRRVVFVRSGKPDQHRDFTSFELPLFLLQDPKFQQPIFGANYMEGTVQPLTSAENSITGNSKWRLTFNKGGCGTFLHVFYRLWNEVLRNSAWTPPPDMPVQLSENPAYVDPNDPSVLYLSQPVVDNTNVQPVSVAAAQGYRQEPRPPVPRPVASYTPSPPPPAIPYHPSVAQPAAAYGQTAARPVGGAYGIPPPQPPFNPNYVP